MEASRPSSPLSGPCSTTRTTPSWPTSGTKRHRRSCAQACYRCIQRYGNRQYHGLLDWRLGLGFLRAMLEPAYRSGLDGNWQAGIELFDWPMLATNVRDDLCNLNSAARKPLALGRDPPSRHSRTDGPGRTRLRDGPPVLARRRRGGLARCARERPQGGRARELHYVDTFDASRRPVSALETARSREAE